jgi:hypothetical protein
MTDLSFRSAWQAISARIHGLEKAAAVHARFLTSNSASPYGADKALQKHCEGIRASVEEFQRSFGKLLPASANSAVERFMIDAGTQIHGNTIGDAQLVRSIIVKLIAFESEMTYCLDDRMEHVRSVSELAFMHLQRLIIVDEDYRKKWQAAFADHETQCEKLGGLHLLWHGIWAFKIDAVGGKTDLVYQEPLVTNAASAALGIVLTEWKKTDNDPRPAYADAKRQATLYSSGVLAGLELTSHRYLVVVTKKQIASPVDTIEGGVTYRHINIAVEPEAPSIAAKRLAK